MVYLSQIQNALRYSDLTNLQHTFKIASMFFENRFLCELLNRGAVVTCKHSCENVLTISFLYLWNVLISAVLIFYHYLISAHAGIPHSAGGGKEIWPQDPWTKSRAVLFPPTKVAWVVKNLKCYFVLYFSEWFELYFLFIHAVLVVVFSYNMELESIIS